MKKLAFVGTHSSGKSTIIDAFLAEEKGKSVEVIRGIARNVVKRGFPLEKGSTVDSYTNYMRDQLRQERQLLTSQADFLFSDRTVLDAASYAKVNAELPRPFVPDYFVEMLLEVALLEARRYDLFVYCPAEFPMVSDPFRPEDEPYRQKVGNQIRNFLKEHNLSYITATGDVGARVKILKDAIRGLNG